MKTGKISDTDWEGILGVHRLFKTINEAVIKDYDKASPLDVLNLIFDPYGIECDAIVVLYGDTDSEEEYFLRMEHVDRKTAYHLDLNSMPKGAGGFLKHATTLIEPQIFPDITYEVSVKDQEVLPWVVMMRTALVVPTIGVTGKPATTILFAYDEDAFDKEYVSRSVILIYAMTNIMLNMLLRREADNVCQALDGELESIGRIQREFLPKELPNTGGLEWAVYYATSTRAGGDYYDFFMLPDDQIGVIIADVAGHGSPAAVVMAMTRLLLHTYPREVTPPLSVLRNVNGLLLGNLLPGQFVTAFYGILDLKKKTLTYSNAGHCSPQLFRARSRGIEKLETKSGLPLGITEDGGFEQLSMDLKKGDVIVFYTDGLREAMNEKKDLYGEGRLQEVLKASSLRPAEEIKNAILGDVLSFCDGEPIRDDLTIIVLKVVE